MSDQGPPKPDRTRPFLEMVEQIRANRDTSFSGAFVIVPPEGESMSSLLINPHPDTAAFLGMVKARLDLALMDIQEQQNQVFGRR